MLTYNVRGLNSTIKHSMFWREALKSQADILCMQESHLLASDTHRLKHKKFPLTFYSTADTTRAGVWVFRPYLQSDFFTIYYVVGQSFHLSFFLPLIPYH